MFRSILVAGLVCISLAAPGLAATVFSDDFSADAKDTRVTKLQNFSVTGNVDIVANGTFQIKTPGGKVVDLDGTRGAGTITSKSSFKFDAGDVVTLAMLVSGAQRSGKDDDLFVKFSFAAAVDVFDWMGSGYFADVKSVGSKLEMSAMLTGFKSDNPFALSSLSFRAGNSGSLKFSIGTRSTDNKGPLLAGVSLDITPTPIPVPAGGALLLLGLGLLGAMRRKRALAAPLTPARWFPVALTCSRRTHGSRP